MKTYFLFLITLIACHAHAETELVLAPGQSQKVSVAQGIPVTLASGKVAKVQDHGSSLTVTGKALGQTRLTAGANTWTVIVLNEKQFSTYRALKDILQSMRGLELSASQGEVKVQGELLRVSDWLEIATSVGPNATYQWAAHLSESMQKQAESKFTQLLRQARLPAPSFQFEPRARLLIPESADAQRASFDQVLRPYGVMVEVGKQIVELEPMIRVNIVVAEVNRSQKLQYGLRWPSSTAASMVLPTGETQSSAEWVLDTLESKGLGKVLASPKLLCRSGKTAEFLAGGEFPIKVSSFKSHDVVWKRHGVLLKIQPQVDLSGNMSVGLETEVSMLDSEKVDGIPGLLTNRIQTHVDLKRSQTIALSGLIKQEWEQTRAGLPLFGRIPILGALFSSRGFQENKTELVVFVTPEVINDDNALLPMPSELKDVQ